MQPAFESLPVGCHGTVINWNPMRYAMSLQKENAVSISEFAGYSSDILILLVDGGKDCTSPAITNREWNAWGGGVIGLIQGSQEFEYHFGGNRYDYDIGDNPTVVEATTMLNALVIAQNYKFKMNNGIKHVMIITDKMSPIENVLTGIKSNNSDVFKRVVKRLTDEFKFTLAMYEGVKVVHKKHFAEYITHKWPPHILAEKAKIDKRPFFLKSIPNLGSNYRVGHIVMEDHFKNDARIAECHIAETIFMSTGPAIQIPVDKDESGNVLHEIIFNGKVLRSVLPRLYEIPPESQRGDDEAYDPPRELEDLVIWNSGSLEMDPNFEYITQIHGYTFCFFYKKI